MSGLPHPFDVPPGKDYKPVLHTIDWREDGVATVRWCGKKYLSDPVVLKKGETKLCPVCAIELRYDRQKKEVVEGGFPKLGGQMNVREALRKRVWFCMLDIEDRKAAKSDFETAIRAGYWEGVEDARYADLHPKDKYATLDGQEGIDAGVAAMMEES